MNVKAILGLTLAGAVLSGCAIHPLPEDVTGLDTYAIVMQIRCEAREAIAHEAIAYLSYSKAPPDIVGALEADPYDIDTIVLTKNNRPRLSEEQLDTLEKYRKASISLEFNLQMTEDNNVGASSSILSTFFSGSDTIGLSLSDNHARRNLRNLKITENWFDLVKDRKGGCVDYHGSSPDYNYPIAGRIGLREVVDTYARINEKTEISSGKQDSSDHAAVDDLQFTTTVSGSASPTRALSTPAGRSLVLKTNGGSLLADRTDQHELIIALFIPQEKTTSKADSNFKTSNAASLQASKRFLFGINTLNSLEDVVPGITR